MIFPSFIVSIVSPPSEPAFHVIVCKSSSTLAEATVKNCPGRQAVEKSGETSLDGNAVAPNLVCPHLYGDRVIERAYLYGIPAVEGSQEAQQEVVRLAEREHICGRGRSLGRRGTRRCGRPGKAGNGFP